MKYICTQCSYIYDEALGEPDLDFDAGRQIDLLENFECPQCGADKDDFVVLDEQVLLPEDTENLTSLESEHIPHISDISGNTLVFEAGESEHPSGENHYIKALSVYDEYGDLIEEKFFQPEDEAKMQFDFGDFDAIELRVSCTQHGTWSSGILDTQDFE